MGWVDCYAPMRAAWDSILYKEYNLPRFNHQKNATQFGEGQHPLFEYGIFKEEYAKPPKTQNPEALNSKTLEP